MYLSKWCQWTNFHETYAWSIIFCQELLYAISQKSDSLVPDAMTQMDRHTCSPQQVVPFLFVKYT